MFPQKKLKPVAPEKPYEAREIDIIKNENMLPFRGWVANPIGATRGALRYMRSQPHTDAQLS
jgi:hypothetical protein